MIGLLKAAATGANPGAALVSLLWKPALVIALVVAGLLWVRHVGYAAGTADKATEIADLSASRDAARQARDTAIAANRHLADSEAALRKALLDNIAESERLAGEGLAAVQAAEADKAQAVTDLATWRRKYGPGARSTNCTAALANLAKACPVKDY